MTLMRGLTLSLSLLLPAFSCPAQFFFRAEVDTADVRCTHPKALLGVSYDGRSSADGDPSPMVAPIGYHDPATGTLLPGVAPLWARVPMTGVRYPGNLVVYNWNWSYTVGPVASRMAQPMGPNGSNPQALAFGFDEFMAMVQGRGLPASEVQLMVNIYPSVGQADPAVLAADWVEYCNAPNNGSNPRGGTDWAAFRAANGIPNPYGVRRWNIGNEPWTPGEFGATTSGADAYMAIASPIIDSMRAADPSIEVTIPMVGQNNSPWNVQILNANAPVPLLGKINGISPHAFYDNAAATPNPLPSNAWQSIQTLAANAASVGLYTVVGDHATFAQAVNTDTAQSWSGADATAEFLLAISQSADVVGAQVWIYGNSAAQWHPIRHDGGGSYTLMAAAQLLEALEPYFLDEALAVQVEDTAMTLPLMVPVGTAFRSADRSRITVLQHATVGLGMVVRSVLPGYTLQDIVHIKPMTPQGSDTLQVLHYDPLVHWGLPLERGTVVIFDYVDNALAVRNPSAAGGLRLHPNPGSGVLHWQWAHAAARLQVLDGLGRVVMAQADPSDALDLGALPAGVYVVRVEDAEGHAAARRWVKAD